MIGLKAADCKAGDLLAVEQAEATSKEQVMKALDKAAASLRTKLGESLATVQKYDAPLELASTPSLEALQAYTKGVNAFDQQGETAGLPMLKRAVELDPNFAMAHCLLGITYLNLNEFGAADEQLRKAFELRERASENEKYLISGLYYSSVTGELEKSLEAYEQWTSSYPRDFVPPLNVGQIWTTTGQFEKALPKTLEGLRLNPDVSAGYANLMVSYVAFGSS